MFQTLTGVLTRTLNLVTSITKLNKNTIERTVVFWNLNEQGGRILIEVEH